MGVIEIFRGIGKKFKVCRYAFLFISKLQVIKVRQKYLLYTSSEIHKLWSSSFFSRCSNFDVDFKNATKSREKTLCFFDNCIEIGYGKFSLLRTEYFSSTVNLLTNSPEISDMTKRHFPTQFLSDWWNNMIKVLSCRFQQCLGPFKMLVVEGCSKMGPCRHLTNHIFCSL